MTGGPHPRRDQPTVEALLRQVIEPLPAEPGVWDQIQRRGKRRRVARRAGAIATVAAAIVAVAVPVGLVLEHPSATEVPVTSQHHPSLDRGPTSDRKTAAGTKASRHQWVIPKELRGFAPTSVSFIEPTQGYLLGINSGGHAALATTKDGGATWKPLTIPGGFNLTSASKPVGGIRFATKDYGFLFGSSFWATGSAGRHWTEWPEPGVVTDLEIAGGETGRMWALVKLAQHPGEQFLYTASVLDPNLKRVKAVPALTGHQTVLSVAFDGRGIFVLSSSPSKPDVRYWSASAGRSWQHASGPCGSLGLMTAIDRVQSSVLCSKYQRDRDVSRTIYDFDHQGGVERLLSQPDAAPVATNANSFSAEQNGNAIIANTWRGRQRGESPFDVTRDGGHSWTVSGPRLHAGAGFVGFIGMSHVVALPQSRRDHVFLYSYNAGRTWSETSFGPGH